MDNILSNRPIRISETAIHCLDKFASPKHSDKVGKVKDCVFV